MRTIATVALIVQLGAPVGAVVEFPAMPTPPQVKNAAGEMVTPAKKVVQWPQVEAVRGLLGDAKNLRKFSQPERGGNERIVSSTPATVVSKDQRQPVRAIAAVKSATDGTEQTPQMTTELLDGARSMERGRSELISPRNPLNVSNGGADGAGVSEAPSVEFTIPELGGITPVDLTAEEPLGEGEFRSKRAELGSPTAIVPAVPTEVFAQNAQILPVAHSNAGSWYKFMAGGLFVASLIIIGIRRFGRITEVEDDETFGAGLGASWLPSRKDSFRPSLGSFVAASPDRMDAVRAMRGGRPALSVRNSVANRLVEKRVVDLGAHAQDQAVELVAEAHRVLSKDISEVACEPENVRAIGFHNEIEKRVRRRGGRSEAAEEVSRRLRGSRVDVDDDQYEQISQMTDQGYKVRDIAEGLSLPMATVTAIQKMRNRSSLGAQASYRGVAH